MTTGQVIFYSGVGLLIFTIVLGVAFWLKKPQYIPGNAAYDQGADKNTRKLRSGYPTDHLTVRREPEQPIMSGTAILQESTAQLEIEQGDTLPDTAVLPNRSFRFVNASGWNRETRRYHAIIRFTEKVIKNTKTLSARHRCQAVLSQSHLLLM